MGSQQNQAGETLSLLEVPICTLQFSFCKVAQNKKNDKSSSQDSCSRRGFPKSCGTTGFLLLYFIMISKHFKKLLDYVSSRCLRLKLQSFGSFCSCASCIMTAVEAVASEDHVGDDAWDQRHH